VWDPDYLFLIIRVFVGCGGKLSLTLQVVDPWVDLGTGSLARGELAGVSAELEHALGLSPSASGWPVGEVASKGAGAPDLGQ